MAESYCLSNFIDYSNGIHQPLKHSNRIKYTCFDVSQSYLVFGSTTGSLYLFRRPGAFVHLIPNKYGCITHVAISANQKYIAFATERSQICVYVLNLSAQTTPKIMARNLDSSQKVQVTCIRWTQDENKFYLGDSRGQVNLVVLPSLIGLTMFSLSVHPLLYLDTQIVQLDAFESLLLVSTRTKCILGNTEYEEYKQIGNRPRDGLFGACFAISPSEQLKPSRIYCARPGTRIWEVDFAGEVLKTLQFKELLAVPPTKIETFGKYSEENSELLEYQPQSLQFAKLQKLTSELLLAFTEFGLYIFDARCSQLVLWCNQFERIADCRVAGNEILIFTQTGSLYSVQLRSLQVFAAALVRQEKFQECACLMRKHVRYFADKAREDYDLKVLNHVKNFLIERQEYELLNDLSVIFDAISQCAGSASDTHSSGGSSANAEERSGSTQASPELGQSTQSLYVLENAFCNNLKSARSERKFKDALLTITGKFGKQFINYKFNIFAEEQQKRLVQDLIPPNERSQPFKDIKARYEPEAAVQETPRKLRNRFEVPSVTAEEKTIFNLHLIFMSGKISNTNFVERYRPIFDERSAQDLIELLDKLGATMVEHGESVEQARRNCYEMYFNYLNPEVIWEMDDETRDYICAGFVLLNDDTDTVRCESCSFALRFSNECAFHDVGAALLRYSWSRNEQVKCFDMLSSVPALLDVLARFYLAEQNFEKVLPIVVSYGQPELLLDVGRHLRPDDWIRCFELYAELQCGRLHCVNCKTVNSVEHVSGHFFYTWNWFLGILLEHITSDAILQLLLEWSECIPNDAVDREFYTRCLLKS